MGRVTGPLFSSGAVFLRPKSDKLEVVARGGEVLDTLSRAEASQLYAALHFWLLSWAVEDVVEQRLGDDRK